MNNRPAVSALTIYPVKSCQGITVQSAMLDRYGFEFDRHWMVVDTAGKFVTQRQKPQMCLIETRLDHEALYLCAPGYEEITVPLSATQPLKECQVTVWQDACLAYEEPAYVNQWLSSFLHSDVRLVRPSKKYQRETSTQYTPQDVRTNKQVPEVSFADGFPFLLISEASLAELNGRLDESISMDRFRPNIVVTGCDAFAEDTWESFHIGALKFFGVKRCSRCAITTVNQQTGNKGKEPLKTLAGYRRGDDGKVYFGQNLIHETYPATLSVGDQVDTESE